MKNSILVYICRNKHWKRHCWLIPRSVILSGSHFVARGHMVMSGFFFGGGNNWHVTLYNFKGTVYWSDICIYCTKVMITTVTIYNFKIIFLVTRIFNIYSLRNYHICNKILLMQWTWDWANSRRWWETGRPGVLQTMGFQRVGHDWVT